MSPHDGELKPLPSGDPNDGDAKFAHFQLRGKDATKFAAFRDKLLEHLEKLLAIEVEKRGGATVKDELQDLACGLLDYAKARLAQPSVKNQKTIAEAAEKFANAKKACAEARKTNAEAANIEFETSLKKFELLIKLCRPMIARDQDEAAILFGKDLEGMLSAIGEYREAVKHLPSP
jgi:hypothetical protein